MLCLQGIKTGSDVAYAFALVIGAGLATTLGAAFAFCANLASKKMLAISLGLSAGVMMCALFVCCVVVHSGIWFLCMVGTLSVVHRCLRKPAAISEFLVGFMCG